MIKATLHTDGGSRGNPGSAGLGFELRGENETILANGGWFLGHATNNVAEYSALVWGLKNALSAGVSHIVVAADSELIVKQINGQYQVKSDDLKPLFRQAKELLTCFEEAQVKHVYREENKAADALANEAMDAACPVGSYLIDWENPTPRLFDEPSKIERKPVMEAALAKNYPYSGPGTLSGESYEDRGGYYELTVKDHFDAAHTLPGYNGPCQFLHGHTWDVEVTVVGEHLDEVGVFYDFKDIKRDLHAVLENFDHRFINDAPPFDAINPTAENLARVIFYEFENTLPETVSLHSVAVWESPQAKIVYRR